jgi:hypothetical protein
MCPAKPQSALRTPALRGTFARYIPVRNALAAFLLRILFLFAHGDLYCKTGLSWLPEMISQGSRSTTPTLFTPLQAR